MKNLRYLAAVAAACLASCAGPILSGGADTPSANRAPDVCHPHLAEATAALTSAADTSAASVAAAHHHHAVKMAEYHACLSRES